VVLFHILAFLNRRKKAQLLAHFAGRRQWQGTVEAFAKQALDLPLELENVTYLSSTVFIYVRSLETVSHPTSVEELNGFIDAMRFVEQASPIRALQSVLTQGSQPSRFMQTKRFSPIDVPTSGVLHRSRRGIRSHAERTRSFRALRTDHAVLGDRPHWETFQPNARGRRGYVSSVLRTFRSDPA